MGKRRNSHSQSGSSLIEMLMSIGLFSFFAAGMSSMSVTQMKSVSSMELRSELQVLRNTITANIDCHRTTRAVCRGKPYIYTKVARMRLPGAQQVGKKVAMADILADLDKDPTIVDATKVTSQHRGSWKVAARCQKTSGRAHDVYLYVSRQDKGEFVPDPLTGQSWSWRDLFEGPVCQGQRIR